MRLQVDEQADALYLRFGDTHITDSQEVAPGIVLDYDENGQVIGLEVLRLSGRVPKINLKELQFQIA